MLINVIVHGISSDGVDMTHLQMNNWICGTYVEPTFKCMYIFYKHVAVLQDIGKTICIS